MVTSEFYRLQKERSHYMSESSIASVKVFALPSWLGDFSYLEQYSPVILADHACELRQYFRTGGIESFGKSTAAGMLARAELYSHGTRPCLRCGGYAPTSDDDPVPERGGCGFVPSNSRRSREVSQKQAELLTLLGIEASEVPAAADMPCPDCGCRGWIVTGRHAAGPLTARPTGSSVRHEPQVGDTDTDLQILSVCGRRLERADRLLPVTSAALSAFLEPDSKGLTGLWHLVPAGKTLLRRNVKGLAPTQFFDVERLAQESNKSPQIARVFDTCNDQSRELLNAAGCAWNAAVKLESKAVR